MDPQELETIAKSLFASAMIFASQEGETVMEDGRDEHAYQTLSAPDLLRAAESFFNDNN
jgi:hypothetical protein